MTVLTPDICVIGMGPGSFAAASIAVRRGLSVVLADNGEAGPGAKSAAADVLLAASRRAAALRRKDLGIAPVEPEVDFRELERQIRSTAAAFAPDYAPRRLTALGIRVLKGPASFRDRKALDAEGMQVRAKRFIVATTARPALPAIDGINVVEHYTVDTIAELARKPAQLIVVGGDDVGVEFAQAYRRLGCEVTLVTSDSVLAGHDSEMAAVVLRRLQAEKLAIIDNANIQSVERRGKTGVRLNVLARGSLSSFDGTHLLVAGGHVANIAELGLKAAGVPFVETGIAVSAALRTPNRRIFAIGEAVRSPAPAQIAERQAARVIDSFTTGKDGDDDSRLVPRLLRTDPELAAVGLSEAEATQGRRGVRILRWPYAENTLAQATRQTDGHIKLTVDAAGKVLGAAIVGAGAGEMIGLWALVIGKEISISDVATMTAASPTFGEIGKRAAISYFSATQQKSILRKLKGIFRV